MLSWIFDRVVRNWQTSAKFMGPAIVGILANKGYNVDLATVTLYLSAVYGLILMFSKDAAKV